jgi:hypothetical protein
MEFENAPKRGASGNTFPVIVTDSFDWGGWRVPKAEYDRDPEKIEFQAQVMVKAMALLSVARDIVALADDLGPNAPVGLGAIASAAQDSLQDIFRQYAPEPAPAANDEDDVSPLLRRLSRRD